MYDSRERKVFFEVVVSKSEPHEQGRKVMHHVVQQCKKEFGFWSEGVQVFFVFVSAESRDARCARNSF